MSLVTVAQYKDITGDRLTDDAVVSSRLEEAQELIEEELDRPLESLERTEKVTLEPDPYGWTSWRAYPAAVPITAIPADALYRIEDTAGLIDVVPDATSLFITWNANNPPIATITYTGGFTADTLPTTLRRCVCELANALANPRPIPVGATSVHAGDVSVTYKEAATGGLDAYLPGLTRRVSRYRRRRRLT